jgi:hypothetical protein
VAVVAAAAAAVAAVVAAVAAVVAIVEAVVVIVAIVVIAAAVVAAGDFPRGGRVMSRFADGRKKAKTPWKTRAFLF